MIDVWVPAPIVDKVYIITSEGNKKFKSFSPHTNEHIFDLMIGEQDSEALLLYAITDEKGDNIMPQLDMRSKRAVIQYKGNLNAIYIESGKYCDYLVGTLKNDGGLLMVSPFLPLNVFGEYASYSSNIFYTGWNDGVNKGSQYVIERYGRFGGIIVPIGVEYTLSSFEEKNDPQAVLFKAFGKNFSRAKIRSFVYTVGYFKDCVIKPEPYTG